MIVENSGTPSGKPKRKVKIYKCGQIARTLRARINLKEPLELFTNTYFPDTQSLKIALNLKGVGPEGYTEYLGVTHDRYN
jgi:hypothetical protein